MPEPIWPDDPLDTDPDYVPAWWRQQEARRPKTHEEAMAQYTDEELLAEDAHVRGRLSGRIRGPLLDSEREPLLEQQRLIMAELDRRHVANF